MPQYKEELFEKYPENVPTEIVKLGLKLKTWTISGSNARCVAMLTAFKSVISNYKTPEGKSLRRDLEPYLTPSIDFLVLFPFFYFSYFFVNFYFHLPNFYHSGKLQDSKFEHEKRNKLAEG